jgi:hypothetical protein
MGTDAGVDKSTARESVWECFMGVGKALHFGNEKSPAKRSLFNLTIQLQSAHISHRFDGKVR